MMKNTLRIKEHLTNTVIYIAYGEDAYIRIGKKHNVTNLPSLNCNGIANEITYQDDNSLKCYIVGISDSGNEFRQKLTIIHELSHITTYIINRYGFEGDEFRSYLLVYLCELTFKWIDNITNN